MRKEDAGTVFAKGAAAILGGLFSGIVIVAAAKENHEFEEKLRGPQETDQDVLREMRKIEEIKRLDARIEVLVERARTAESWSRQSILNELERARTLRRNLLISNVTDIPTGDVEIIREQHRYEENARLEARINDLQDRVWSMEFSFRRMSFETEIENLRQQQRSLNR